MGWDMKKILFLSLILLAFSWPAFADTIIFRDGMRVEVSEVWEEGGEVRCRIGDIFFGYPKDDVERIEKGRAEGNMAAAPALKVHKEVTVTPRKEAAVQKKDTASPDTKAEASRKAAVSPKKEAAASKKQTVTPKQKAVVSKKETSVPKKEAVVSKKEALTPKKEAPVSREPQAVSQKTAPIPKKKKGVPGKEIPASKKKKSQKAIAAKYASIPSFKVLINEDDSNPPVYIKRRRVLLVPRGLAKARIRTLLLSYEKKIRNELKAQKARYKQIMIWVYDDFERADEGAGGWVGMITNDSKADKLSDNPTLLLK